MDTQKQKKLTENFLTALQQASQLATNFYLVHLKETVEKIDVASRNQDQVLKNYVEELNSIAENPNFAINPKDTNEFVQLLGEAHFYFLCSEKGIKLSRIPEGKNKTPDFKMSDGKIDLYFEVKTLSVVDGDIGIKKALNSALASQIEIEAQLNTGKDIASSTTTIQPYGDGSNSITTVINTLLEKARGNIKAEQYKNPNSFLVLNLSVIKPRGTGNYILRPAYCDNHLFPKALTGELWMLSFGRVGMLIHGQPEFEGKSCLEGTFDKVGILSDPDYSDISGVLFMVHQWGQPTEIWGQFRSSDRSAWLDSQPEIIDNLKKLTVNNWNDDLDSNGWRLNGVPSP